MPDELLDAARSTAAASSASTGTSPSRSSGPASPSSASSPSSAPWNDYFWPLIVLTDPDHVTLQVALSQLNVAHGKDYSMVMAGALLAVVPLVVIFTSSPAIHRGRRRRGQSVAEDPTRELMRQRRFGLFIHWGIYALAARHEWVKQPRADQRRGLPAVLRPLRPRPLRPGRLGATMAEARRHEVLRVTTKHHDGFCLWDSALTDYKATNTPAGRDLLAPVGRGLPRRGAQGRLLPLAHRLAPPRVPRRRPAPACATTSPSARRRRTATSRKYAEYLHGQTRELLTQFGKIDIMWFDFSYPGSDWGWSKGKGKDDWQSEKLMAMVRELQPDIIVNDRLELGGDIKTPEQYQPHGRVTVDGKPVLWEACQTFNGSWGYDRDNLDWQAGRHAAAHADRLGLARAATCC